jgi:DNA-binding response OmpR family regulator
LPRFAQILKVLFVSGYADDTVPLKGVPNLTRDFLQKPFPLRSLAGKIREVLEQPGIGAAPRVQRELGSPFALV